MANDAVYKLYFMKDNDQETEGLEFVVPGGADGVSVTGAAINANGHLIISLSEGQPIDAGLAKGANGKNGVTFTPSVDDDGTLRWTNDGLLDNPADVNIKGDPPVLYIVSNPVSGGHDVSFYVDGKRQDYFTVLDGAKGDDGVSPAVSVEPITGGNRVTIGDVSFDVLNGTGGGGGSGLNNLVDGETAGSVKGIAAAIGAIGYNSVALGSGTAAPGENAFAKGFNTRANARASSAEGMGTVAGSSYQHVQGAYNIPDSDMKYSHIVGNGTASAPANSHTLDWDGNAWFAGKVFVGGTGMDDPNATELGAGGGSEMTDLETIALLTENDLLPAITDGSGRILTDSSGKIMLRY